jgi:hypothetical protein
MRRRRGLRPHGGRPRGSKLVIGHGWPMPGIYRDRSRFDRSARDSSSVCLTTSHLSRSAARTPRADLSTIERCVTNGAGVISVEKTPVDEVLHRPARVAVEVAEIAELLKSSASGSGPGTEPTRSPPTTPTPRPSPSNSPRSPCSRHGRVVSASERFARHPPLRRRQKRSRPEVGTARVPAECLRSGSVARGPGPRRHGQALVSRPNRSPHSTLALAHRNHRPFLIEGLCPRSDGPVGRPAGPRISPRMVR